MIKIFNSLFVTMFGLGKIKFIPGTFGSLATVIILYFLFHTMNISSNTRVYTSARASLHYLIMYWEIMHDQPHLALMHIPQQHLRRTIV